MILAAILTIWFLCPVSSSARFVIQSNGQEAPAATSPAPSAQQGQGDSPAPQSQNPPSTPAETPTATTPPKTPSTSATQKRRHRKKKSASATNCPADANLGQSSTPTTAAQSPSGCPPAKTVVRNGGTSEPSVQLKGGGASAQQASHQQDTTNQLLVSTEDSLKKTDGRQLTSNQQEMVNQIRQFMEQSKAAVAAGDTARAHNLAIKAHLLSIELLKP